MHYTLITDPQWMKLFCKVICYLSYKFCIQQGRRLQKEAGEFPVYKADCCLESIAERLPLGKPFKSRCSHISTGVTFWSARHNKQLQEHWISATMVEHHSECFKVHVEKYLTLIPKNKKNVSDKITLIFAPQFSISEVRVLPPFHSMPIWSTLTSSPDTTSGSR